MDFLIGPASRPMISFTSAPGHELIDFAAAAAAELINIGPEKLQTDTDTRQQQRGRRAPALTLFHPSIWSPPLPPPPLSPERRVALVCQKHSGHSGCVWRSLSAELVILKIRISMCGCVKRAGQRIAVRARTHVMCPRSCTFNP